MLLHAKETLPLKDFPNSRHRGQENSNGVATRYKQLWHQKYDDTRNAAQCRLHHRRQLYRLGGPLLAVVLPRSSSCSLHPVYQRSDGGSGGHDSQPAHPGQHASGVAGCGRHASRDLPAAGRRLGPARLWEVFPSGETGRELGVLSISSAVIL